jgi:hypothetical protein
MDSCCTYTCIYGADWAGGWLVARLALALGWGCTHAGMAGIYLGRMWNIEYLFQRFVVVAGLYCCVFVEVGAE